MALNLVARAAIVIVLGGAAGALHAHFRQQSSPLVLRAKEAEPLDISKYIKPAEPQPQPPFVPPNEKPATPVGTQPPAPQPPPPPPPPTEPREVGLHITIEQAKLLFDSKIAFVDARHLDEFEAGHVDNAFLLSSDDVTSGKGTEVLSYLDKGSPIVVYCNGGACDASENLVKVLQVLGYKGCRIMTDGYPAWQKAGYPTATGKPAVGGG